MWISFLIVVGIVGICVLLLGIRIFFVKGGRFPDLHLKDNEALKNKGIQCAGSQNKVRD